MDITFSASNHRTLTLISCTSLSTSHCSSFSPKIRLQFLGCRHNLRPQGLRTRTKCKKLGFHVQSSRFFVRASLNSQTVIVYIAVATLSLISFSFLSNWKKKKSLKEGESLVVGEVNKEKPRGESISLTGVKIENNLVSKVSEAPLHIHETTLSNEEIIFPQVSNGSFANDLSSSVSGYESDSHLSEIVIKNQSNGASVATENLCLELEKLSHEGYGNGESNGNGGTNGNGSLFIHPVREELHTFYDKKHVTKSTASYNVLEKSSTNGSLMEHNTITSPMREYDEVNAILTCPKEVSLYKRRVDKSVNFLKDKGGIILPQKDHQNGMCVTEKLDPSKQLSVYNLLLRDGRLIDCIELLEEMERNILLDMNKVYHSRFFETCKKKKAVKEAFRFTKLISNPTLSTFNMLMSVCAHSQDSEGAFKVMQVMIEAGLKADCKLYTTLIASCAKSGKVDAMFEVFHEMVNAKVEPNVHTYGALIDGCGRAGQVAKAFGAYGILRSKLNVKPDRVIFNALITACGQSGAVDRAFDVLAEMRSEIQPIDPDHITVGALITACAKAGQIHRAKEVYKMVHKYNIKGTPELYTIAVSICSQTGDWEFARNVFNDMMGKGIVPDEMFLSALVDVAGHAGELDVAFEVMREIRIQGIRPGIVSYSSLMGACSNANSWEKALELYENIKSMRLTLTVSTMNALLTALCNGDQLEKAMKVLSEMKNAGLNANSVTYSILLVASEKKDDLEVGLSLFSQAKEDGLAPNLLMSRCLISMCLRRFKKACKLGESVLSFNSGQAGIDTEWTSLALMIYRETIDSGLTPSIETFSEVLGCLQLPHEASLRNRIIEDLGVSVEPSKYSNLSSLINGFGEYDPRAFSLLEEAASIGILPGVSLEANPIIVDARSLPIHTAEVYLLTVLKSLKNQHAAGARLPSISILLPIEKTKIPSSKGEKTVNLAGRIGQVVTACLRRLGLRYQGHESFGRIRINGLSVKRWLNPKLASPFSGMPEELSSTQSRLGKGIAFQQREIRSGTYCLE